MEWESEELNRYFDVLNKVFSLVMKKKYPYIKFISLDPVSFQEQVNSGKWSVDVNVFVCADFELQKKKYSHIDTSLGTDLVTIMMDLQKMISVPEILKERKIYPSLVLNRKTYCEEFIKYTY